MTVCFRAADKGGCGCCASPYRGHVVCYYTLYRCLNRLSWSDRQYHRGKKCDLAPLCFASFLLYTSCVRLHVQIFKFPALWATKCLLFVTHQFKQLHAELSQPSRAEMSYPHRCNICSRRRDCGYFPPCSDPADSSLRFQRYCDLILTLSYRLIISPRSCRLQEPVRFSHVLPSV